tara:strand:+ start:207 stop:404 length:198 start_codon:yes stop_codon:yes gene_type:complete
LIVIFDMSESKGLGDTIEKIAIRTKIKALVEANRKRRGKKECGCKKRKDKLNTMFPYKNTKNEDV